MYRFDVYEPGVSGLWMPIRKTSIRVPVKWKEGKWEAVLGDIGEPKVGAPAELYIDRKELADPAQENARYAARGHGTKRCIGGRTDLTEDLELLQLEATASPIVVYLGRG